MATAGDGAAAAAPDNRSVRYKSKLASRLDDPGGDGPHAAKQAKASTGDGAKVEVTSPSGAEATRSSTDGSTFLIELNTAEGPRRIEVSFDWQPEDTAEAVAQDMLVNEAIGIDKNLNSLQDLTQQIENQRATKMDVLSGDHDDEQMKLETKLRSLAEGEQLSEPEAPRRGKGKLLAAAAAEAPKPIIAAAAAPRTATVKMGPGKGASLLLAQKGDALDVYNSKVAGGDVYGLGALESRARAGLLILESSLVIAPAKVKEAMLRYLTAAPGCK